MTTAELTPYDKDEVCEPKVWLDADPVNNGNPGWGKVDFDLSDHTVIAGLRVTPSDASAEAVVIDFGSNVESLVIREVNGVRIRIVDPVENPYGVDNLEAKIAQAARAIDQTSDVDDDDLTRLADTIASLYHWADAHGIDYCEAADRAERYKAAELADWEIRAEQEETA